MEANSSIISEIMDIPGSSFRIQIMKKSNSAVIRILRGLKVTREVEISLGELTKKQVVTIIQSELFMPISPFKIMKIVEELFKNIEDKEKAAALEAQLSEQSHSVSTNETGLQSAPVHDIDESKSC